MYYLINTSDVEDSFIVGSKRVVKSFDESKTVIMFKNANDVPDSLDGYEGIEYDEFIIEIDSNFKFWLGYDKQT
tara:strand:+ start:2003 stop:2224 length:222 start_codon:yes stop_codon:yes gene_type:complete